MAARGSLSRTGRIHIGHIVDWSKARGVASPTLHIRFHSGCISPRIHPGGEMIHLLVHDKKDTVGVAVIEGIKAGQEMIGWVMEDDSTIKVKAINDIPIGHKAALREIKKGDTIIKYGFDIGKAVADIKVGEHAHVHNIKTKRW
jgi:(2R)-sulfolactate sulfo-lyase subunit alpha